MKIQTQSARETQELASRLAREVLKMKPATGAVVLALRGDLGSGKTTFAQGFAEALGVKELVLSPTFLVVREFPLTHKNKTMLYHIDTYRLTKSQELLDLGFPGMIKDPSNIVLIEWADKVKDVLPENTLWLDFSFIDETTRAITYPVIQ